MKCEKVSNEKLERNLFDEKVFMEKLRERAYTTGEKEAFKKRR
jgi:hypothetical protein